jgi:transcriptional regulator GlxA family with amidase domain
VHRIAVVAFEGLVPFDLATPCEVFGRARRANGGEAYALKVCGAAGRIDAGLIAIIAPHRLTALSWAQTIIVPGVQDLNHPLPPELLRRLQQAARRGARIASICTGAFVLGAAGLLDGKRATTHWAAATELARRYPRIEVDADVLYVDSGKLLTSAGAAAGLDLCLHLVRKDFGAAVAAETARLSVMPLEREGGQAQFIRHRAPNDATSLTPLLRWADEHLAQGLTNRALARNAATSLRTLNRRFKDELGTTPAQWLKAAQLRRAQQLLETGAQSIERVAELSGFGSTAALRARFQAHAATSPQAYRRAFQSRHAGSASR